jgi:predicted phage terminase large subunit-like protein
VGRARLGEVKQQMRDLNRWALERYGRLPHTVLVENTALGPDVIAELRGEISGIRPVTPQGDKTMRAHAVAPQVEAHQVFVPGFMAADGSGPDTGRTPLWAQEFVDECAGFPNGSHDDQVDAMSQALNWARVGAGSFGSRSRSARRSSVALSAPGSPTVSAPSSSRRPLRLSPLTFGGRMRLGRLELRRAARAAAVPPAVPAPTDRRPGRPQAPPARLISPGSCRAPSTTASCRATRA